MALLSLLMYASVHSSPPQSYSGGDTSCLPVKFAAFDIVAIAASAGGIRALPDLLSVLPGDFPCPLVIAKHLCPSSRYKSVLDRILASQTPLTVKWAENGELLKAGSVHAAPQDRHVEITPDRRVRLLASGKVNGSRPAADPLFLSVAREYGRESIGVILSGALDDGAEGAFHIGAAGGRVLASCRIAKLRCSPTCPGLRFAPGQFTVLSPEMIAHALITLVMAPGAAAWFQVWPSRPARNVFSGLVSLM